MGENLQEFTIKLNLHSSFCVSEDEILKIRTEAQLGKPLKFIKGNGEYVGTFVISQIQKTTEQTSPEGKVVSATVKNEKCVKGDTLKLDCRCENKQHALIKAKAAHSNGNHTIDRQMGYATNVEVKNA